MKNYILWIITGGVIFILCYFFLYWDKLFDKKDNDTESWVITWSSLDNNTKNVDNDHYDYLTQWFPNYTWLTDVTNEVQWQLYNSYSPYLLNEIGRAYSFSGMLLWILHNNVLNMKNGEEWLWWQPWFIVKDTGKECHRWNRITGFVEEWEKLIMTILDVCGGGSMEWYVSSYELQFNNKRVLNGCYNYANYDPFQELAPEEYKDMWYYRWTRQLDQLQKEPLEICEGNIEIEYYR